MLCELGNLGEGEDACAGEESRRGRKSPACARTGIGREKNEEGVGNGWLGRSGRFELPERLPGRRQGTT